MHIGIASASCETTSGGVMTAATMKIADDHVAADVLQLLDADDADPASTHHDDGHLEGDAERDEHRQHEAEVRLDVGRRRDALRREVCDELEDLRTRRNSRTPSPTKKSSVLLTTAAAARAASRACRGPGRRTPTSGTARTAARQERRHQRDLHGTRNGEITPVAIIVAPAGSTGLGGAARGRPTACLMWVACRYRTVKVSVAA